LDSTGNELLITMPFSHHFQDPDMLTHHNHSWMVKNDDYYEIERNSKHAGLGPAIAEAHT